MKKWLGKGRDLLLWTAVEGQLHPWKRGMVLGGLAAVVVLAGLRLIHQVENMRHVGFAAMSWVVGLVGGAIQAVALCAWVLSRSSQSLWRTAAGWCATVAFGSSLTALAQALHTLDVKEGSALTADTFLSTTAEWSWDYVTWAAVFMAGQAFAARRLPRGATGYPFRSLALLAGGLMALYPVIPFVVFPPNYVTIDLDHFFVVPLSDIATAVLVMGFGLWMVLWLRHGHRWRGWFGLASFTLPVVVTLVLVAKHLYAGNVSPVYYGDAAGQALMYVFALLAAAPFLWIARVGDRATAIPLDHPARDAVARD